MYNRSRESSREIVKKSCFNLEFHNGVLQWLPPLLAFLKMTVNHLIENWYIGNQREKVPPLAFLGEKYVCLIAAGKIKLRQMKCVMQVIERIERMEGIYKDREGWYLVYEKLLWEKVGYEHLLSGFGGININSEMSWKTIYNNIVLVK